LLLQAVVEDQRLHWLKLNFDVILTNAVKGGSETDKINRELSEVQNQFKHLLFGQRVESQFDEYEERLRRVFARRGYDISTAEGLKKYENAWEEYELAHEEAKLSERQEQLRIQKLIEERAEQARKKRRR
jgi:hypothetical protein